MLVLTRCPNESIEIQIGQGITVSILEVKGKQVRIGIDAPQEITILRTELVTREKQQTMVAA